MFHVEHFEGWIEVLREGAASLGVPLHEYSLTQFAVYLRELKQWNEKTNLTGSHDDKEIVVKHFVDSMAACRILLPIQDPHLLDIGSGAGFPGLVLKLIVPELHVTLLEPSQKRVAFLRHMIGKLHLKEIEVVDQRIESYAMMTQVPELFGWATTRALSISSFLGPIHRLLSEKGKLLLYRTRVMDKRMLTECRDHNFSVFQQLNYELIQNFGSRVLTVIQKTPVESVML